jgi:hypothetical protein
VITPIFHKSPTVTTGPTASLSIVARSPGSSPTGPSSVRRLRSSTSSAASSLRPVRAPVVLYQESIADPELTMCSIEWFPNDAAPQLTSG